MKKKKIAVGLLVPMLMVLFSAGFAISTALAEESLADLFLSTSTTSSPDGSWSVTKTEYSTRWNTENVFGPFEAMVAESGNKMNFSIEDHQTNALYQFHVTRSGNQLTGTGTLSGNMGVFKRDVKGEVSADGNAITLRSDYINSYNGSTGRWERNYEDKETWAFTR